MGEQLQYPVVPHIQPAPRECNTCRHDGKSIEEWPCRTSLNAAGLDCWEPKEERHV